MDVFGLADVYPKLLGKERARQASEALGFGFVRTVELGLKIQVAFIGQELDTRGLRRVGWDGEEWVAGRAIPDLRFRFTVHAGRPDSTWDLNPLRSRQLDRVEV